MQIAMTPIDISPELQYKTSRSGGNGGQNVNKTETKVEAIFFIEASLILTLAQKEILLQKLALKINKDGAITAYSQATRSQLSNKEIVTKQMNDLVNKALIKKKMRKPTKIPKIIKEGIIETKKKRGETKQLRQKIRL